MIKLNIKFKNIPCYVYMNICYFKEENGEKVFADNDFEVVESKRINIDYSEEAKDYLWRFYIKDNKYVSVK